MVDNIPHLYPLNPFSGAVVHLPHLWANCSPVFDEYLFKVVWSAKPTDPNFVIVFLKRDAYSAVYCRTGDARWKLIHDSLELSDAIFYKEKLYVVDDEEGCVAAVDLLHQDVVEEIRMPELVAFARGSHLERMYLAAGPSGLLFIVRQMKRSRYCSQGRNVKLQTGGFKVFELDETTTKWNETKSLGDGMLFLGLNESMWLPSSNFKECKGNCIYFTDDSSYNIRRPILREDSGIFHLEDGRFGSFYGDSTKRLYPNPVWVVPHP
ncbi:hypothetical protein QJS04_geneDACA006001 [Acorus gramineus]|uniref:KIB1-4 beta-propeller domain-containing protein n=1 Tax=Acorus gramineus TaxID=55184 RepID=A0AAV9B5H0_ACOGR|nr:hypothetical protein QJS04_geneDACA006001 [Acorus gramineus]